MQIYVTGFEIWNNSDFNAAENMCNLHTVHHTLHHIWQSWHKICIENQATPLKKTSQLYLLLAVLLCLKLVHANLDLF